MTQLYQSKIFANGSTTLPQPVRGALGVQAGNSVRYVIFEDGVQVLRVPSDDNGLKIHAHDPALLESMAAAEDVMDENRTLLRELK
ncbi:hypothetical protein N9N27_04520 [Planktomarina sp.]|nr:hypothetical protein [Planktomarina sp.]